MMRKVHDLANSLGFFMLGAIPLTHFVDMIHIRRDRLFLLDRERGVKFYEYRITESMNPASWRSRLGEPGKSIDGSR